MNGNGVTLNTLSKSTQKHTFRNRNELFAFDFSKYFMNFITSTDLKISAQLWRNANEQNIKKNEQKKMDYRV